MRHLHGRSLAAIGVLLALACLAGGGEVALAAEAQVFVPWKVLNPGDEPARGAVVLYWLPASREDIRRSPLLTSRPLAVYAAQCVGMQLIRPDDVIMIERLGESAKLPAVVIATAEGEILDRAENDRGVLHLADVERMTRDVLTRLESETDRMLDDAAATASSGNRDGASALYQKVVERKCLFPRKAREAEKALKKLR